MTQLATCDQCQRKGRAQNLSLHYGRFLCPNCLRKEPEEDQRYFIMHYWMEGTQKRIQVFDMKEGKLYRVWEQDYLDGKLDEKMLQDMALEYEEKVKKRGPYKA